MTEQTLPSEVAFRVEALPASNGDCILVSCPTPSGTWRCLVDIGPGNTTGAGKTWPLLRTRLSALPRGPHGQRHIDLLILTHIDHDHIGAQRHLFADRELGLTFGDIWFNGRRHLGVPETRGVAEAEALSILLSADLPWNRTIGGSAIVVTMADSGFREMPSAGCPRITLLAPIAQRLATLANSWDKECALLEAHRPNTREGSERGTQFPDLEALVAYTCTQNRTPTNGSSIAILLEHQGASILLPGDAFAIDIARALLALARRRGLSLPLKLDAVKLSHHGSRASLTTKLFRTLIADNYLISTDNHRFGHPHDEALARVVLYGGPHPVLCFNYSTAQNRRWSNRELQRTYGFGTLFPEAAADGIMIDLPRRSRDLLQTS